MQPSPTRGAAAGRPLHRGVRGALLAAALLGQSASIAPATAQNDIRLPDIGSSSEALLSPDMEQRIGYIFMRQLRRSTQILDDPEFQQYIGGLGFRLAAHSSSPYQPFRFFIVDNKVINAFAGPGGNIGMHTGLVLLTESEAELASVMAHEIAHVTQRHLPRAFEQAKRMTLPTIAAMVGALILGAVDPDAGAAAITAVQAGSAQMQIDFTRSNEQEADRAGLEILYRSGYDPRAMPRFFERMQEASRFAAGNNIPEFLRTHPLTQSRIADTRSRALAYPPRPAGDDERYRHIRARLTVQAAPYAEEAVRTFERRLAEAATEIERVTARYGLAYAYLRAGRIDAARDTLAPLLDSRPQRLAHFVAAARIEAAAGQFEAALRHLRDAARLYPGDLILTYVTGTIELRAGNAEKARELLQDYVRRDQTTPAAYELLAQAASATGRRVEAHQMQAEYHYRTGNLEEAMRQLRIASRIEAASFIETAQIESRLRQFEQELELQNRLL